MDKYKFFHVIKSVYTEPKKKLPLRVSADNYTNMKIRIKLDLYVLKEYFIVTVWKKDFGEGLSKSSEMVVKMRKGSLTKIPNWYWVTDHLQHCYCIGHVHVYIFVFLWNEICLN